MDDSERFYKLIWPQAPTLLRFAQTLCRNSADAEDLVQETLVKAFRHLEQFQEGTDAKSWLIKILRNTRIDRLRVQANRKENVSLDALEVDTAAPETAPRLDRSAWHDPQAMLESLGDQQLIDLLLELPEEIRWSLLLVDVEGLELNDAAAVMEVPTGTVKSRLHRGRGMLKQKLESVAGEKR